jgi:hypothetical protein
MTKHIRACSCGCKDFTVKELSVYDASIEDDGLLFVDDNPDNQITEIRCYKCGMPYSPTDFKDIQFN